jgi:thiamine pyrophosphokinase
LLTGGRDEHGREILDVAHEALIRDWPRLRAWIDADRAGLLTHRRLTDAARDWELLGRDAGALYRGARLGTAQEWVAGHEDALSALERDYLAGSRHAEHAERQRELTDQQAALARASLLVAATVTALAVWALGQRSDAQT